jgi:hypothetical protein
MQSEFNAKAHRGAAATKEDGGWKVEDGKTPLLQTHKKSSQTCTILGYCSAKQPRRKVGKANPPKMPTGREITK